MHRRQQHQHRHNEPFFHTTPPLNRQSRRVFGLPWATRGTLWRLPLYLTAVAAPLYLAWFLPYNADPVFSVRPAVLRAGQTLAVRADKSNNRHDYCFATDSGTCSAFWPDSAGLPRGLAAFPLETAPGLHTVTVKRNGKPLVQAKVFVHSGITETIHLRLPKGRRTALLSRTKELRAAKKLLPSAFETSPGQQLWRGTFVLPAQGRYSSPMGQLRVLENGKTTFHAGQDISGLEGTPVTAANRGLVTLAENLPLQGNMVVLAHGQGVFTMYEHLASIEVKKGDLAEKGAPLGTLGNTGYSTGPHLHWGMAVNGQHADPMQWLTEEF